MKHVLIQFNFPDTDVKIYEGIIKGLEAAGLANVPGRLYHVAAQYENGWHVTDVWESEEAFNKFGETMVPLLVKNGGTPVEPSILPVHNIITPE